MTAPLGSKAHARVSQIWQRVAKPTFSRENRSDPAAGRGPNPAKLLPLSLSGVRPDAARS